MENDGNEKMFSDVHVMALLNDGKLAIKRSFAQKLIKLHRVSCIFGVNQKAKYELNYSSKVRIKVDCNDNCSTLNNQKYV